MKLTTDPRLPLDGVKLAQRLSDLLTQTARQVNGLSEGRISAVPALTAAPTTGLWAQGDRAANSAPAVLGTGGSQYVIDGWVCVVGGEPGTWTERRSLTGT